MTQKTPYFKILNKIKIPRIPPILFNNKLITNCAKKATLFKEYLLAQCEPNVNNSNLPYLSYHTEKKSAP